MNTNNDTQYEFERYIPVLRKAAAKYKTYFENDGEEAYSEMSLALWEAVLYYNSKQSEFNEALAFTVCANRAKYYMRKQLAKSRGAGKQFANVDIDNIAHLIEGSNDIDELLEAERLSTILNNALAIANEEQRQLIEHRLAIGKQSNKAIGAKLGVSHTTVARRLKSLHKRYLKLHGTIA